MKTTFKMNFDSLRLDILAIEGKKPVTIKLTRRGLFVEAVPSVFEQGEGKKFLDLISAHHEANKQDSNEQFFLTIKRLAEASDDMKHLASKFLVKNREEGYPVDVLKSEGKFYDAGHLAMRLGHDRAYGPHFGMKSSREADMKEFFRGFDAAIAEQRASLGLSKIKATTERLARDEEIEKRLGSKVGVKSFKRVKNVEPAKIEGAKASSKYDYPAGLNEAQKKAFRAKMRKASK